MLKLTGVVCALCVRFIIGKEEIPNHSVMAAEHTCTRPLERTAAIETGEDSPASAERPSSRRKTLLAYTRELLESM